MPVVTAVHIVFDQHNDPQGFAKRHVARQIGRGKTQNEIVREAWQYREHPVVNAITSQSFQAPPIPAGEIYYDPAVIGGASEQDVIEALIKAGQRP